ncbi:hypothetical protein IE077_004517 [Cardiosporidium cionae]|uniref:Ribosomal protein L27 n=1 Tax=Cardiosporidium cionae TaxID=476202 RepID=A0ABQ7J4M7_9APIC|nr:hypothetical protein IE077_004517 [Cardiosporidium cionae]|eukprot:KAF8817731.1 hypothetical protein IE077_004517 [Cardiosporidium cionae]
MYRIWGLPCAAIRTTQNVILNNCNFSVFSNFNIPALRRITSQCITPRLPHGGIPFCISHHALNINNASISSPFRHSPIGRIHVASRSLSNLPHLLSGDPFASRCLLPVTPLQCRTKMVKVTAYHRKARSYPFNQTRKPHIGIKKLSGEFVHSGYLLVKQRKFIAWNPHVTRHRHFKYYPGENVGVIKSTSLVALCSGRVKFTHDVSRDVRMVNVLPEVPDLLLKEDCWRYRTEHVASMEENKHLCYLRTKASPWVEPSLVQAPTKAPPRNRNIASHDAWEHPLLPNSNYHKLRSRR